MMRSLLILPFVLSLAACGDAPDTPYSNGEDVPASDAAAVEPAADAPSAALSGTAPDGSVGSLTLRVAESDEDGASFSEVAAYLPAPAPDDAVPMMPLDEMPDYHVRIDKTTLPDGFELSDTHFIFVKRRADGSLDKAALLRGWVGLSNTYTNGSHTGSVGGITFAPLWPEDGPVPGLSYDTMGDDERQLATSPLAVIARPVWAQPITLPATSSDPSVTAELDIDAEDLDALGVRLYLLHAQYDDFMNVATWNLEDFRKARSLAREREDDPSAPTTVPYVVYPDDLGDGPTEAYLIAFRN